MSNKIKVYAQKNGKSILVNWQMLNELNEIVESGNMGVDLVHINALDYSQSPPIPWTQEQRIQIIVDQVKENLQRFLHVKDASETDGDLAIAALNDLEVLP